MSDLQLGLLAIGVLVVVGVIAYNKLQETRLRRRAQADFGSRHEDVLLGGAKSAGRSPEDVPDRFGQDQSTVERSSFSRDIEHTLAEHSGEAATQSAEALSPAAGSAQGGPRVLEEAVDFIVSVECPTATAGSEVLKQAATLAHEAMRRPIHWEAQDTGHGEWEQPSAQKRYRRVRDVHCPQHAPVVDFDVDGVGDAASLRVLLKKPVQGRVGEVEGAHRRPLPCRGCGDALRSAFDALQR